jgi:hypothetical protein
MDYATPNTHSLDCLLTPVDDDTRQWLCICWLVTTYLSECEPKATETQHDALLDEATRLVECKKVYCSQQLTNLWEAMKLVKMHTADAGPPITKDLVLQLHAAVVQSTGDDVPGALRTTNVRRADAIFPPHTRVDALLTRLLARNRYEGVRVLDPKGLLEANVRFVSTFLKVRPFKTGNGRVARLLFAAAMKEHFPLLFAPSAWGAMDNETFHAAVADSQRVCFEGGMFFSLYHVFASAALRTASEVAWMNDLSAGAQA